MNSHAKFKVGDLVTWTVDQDIGIVTDIDRGDLYEESGYEPYLIRWFKDPSSSGWHAPHECLILINSA